MDVDPKVFLLVVGIPPSILAQEPKSSGFRMRSNPIKILTFQLVPTGSHAVVEYCLSPPFPGTLLQHVTLLAACMKRKLDLHVVHQEQIPAMSLMQTVADKSVCNHNAMMEQRWQIKTKNKSRCDNSTFINFSSTE